MLSKVGEEYHDRQMLINELVYDDVDIECFNKEYDIYELQCIKEKPWINFDAQLFDRLDDLNAVESVSFLGGSKAYILMKKFQPITMNDFLTNEEQVDYQFNTFELNELDKQYKPVKLDIMYTLLLNALSKYQGEHETYSNVKGHLYLEVLTDEEKNGQHILMEISVKNGLLNRKQWSLCEYDDNALWQKNKPKYTLKEGPGTAMLVKKYKGEGKAYVIGAPPYNSRTIILVDQLVLKDKKHTKVEMYEKLTKSFNNRYSKFAKLDFQCHNVKTKEIEKFGKVKSKKKDIIEKLGKVYYVHFEEAQTENEINNEKELIKQLKTLCPVVKEVKHIKKDALNIVVIHNSEYYQQRGQTDRKLKINKNIITQCITCESLDCSLKEGKIHNLALHLLNELCVKKELYQRKIERWNYDAMEFYLGMKTKGDKNKNEEYHCLMKIAKDGSFTITSTIEDIDKNHYRKYLNEINYQGNVCIVKHGEDYNRIYHTDYSPMIDYQAVEDLEKQSKEKGNTVSRIKSKVAVRDGLAYPYYGKSVMVIDNQLHYCVGESDGGLMYDVKTMCNIYRLEQMDGSNIIYDILDLLEDIHVRCNSIAGVRPFPFKYMLEYLRINHVGKSFIL
ncbi:hypothetical protein SAMN05421767_1433 [Granulicatella balaenopterae]|uniref:Piwi domain-containing protein n=1 Tax=Granulicatella balaenopterae TaxID=137733 RepID=A0A1H9NNX4_9LACT|nr:hypothetical protein [Granulicatella balaenopterae]SER37602.1 hypothetical protein SAMN05421767_1433 [Granulicatella balaenopterae]